MMLSPKQGNQWTHKNNHNMIPNQCSTPPNKQAVLGVVPNKRPGNCVSQACSIPCIFLTFSLAPQIQCWFYSLLSQPQHSSFKFVHRKHLFFSIHLQLFGYFQSDGDGDDLTVGEDVSVFTVSARRRVGDAAGTSDQSSSICI